MNVISLLMAIAKAARKILQQGVQVGIVLNQRAIQLAPQLAVRLVAGLGYLYVYSIQYSVLRCEGCE